MNTFYVWGPILDKLGVATWQRSSGRTDIEACPVDGGLADEQAHWIPVHVRHQGPVIGEVVGIEHVYDQVMVLAEVDIDRVDPYDLPADADWFWSARIQRGPGSNSLTVKQGKVIEVSLTQSPASLLRAVRSTRNRPNRQSPDEWQRRAAEAIDDRRRDPSAPLRIRHLDERGRPIRQPAIHRAAGHRGPDGVVYQTSGHLGRVLSVS